MSRRLTNPPAPRSGIAAPFLEIRLQQLAQVSSCNDNLNDSPAQCKDLELVNSVGERKNQAK
jgi:hypothetical protein